MVEKLQEDNVALRQEIKNLDQRRLSFQQNTVSFCEHRNAFYYLLLETRFLPK